MSANNDLISRDELLVLHEQFREIKHGINNTLAVIMALSELAERNPAHYEKLSKAVLSRGPEIVTKLQEFSVALSAKMKGEESSGSGPAPTSGVF